MTCWYCHGPTRLAHVSPPGVPIGTNLLYHYAQLAGSPRGAEPNVAMCDECKRAMPLPLRGDPASVKDAGHVRPSQ